MPPRLADKLERDLSVGTAWLVVLAAISAAEEPIHGYEIGRRLADEAPEGLSFKQGTLYPMLRAMESDGLVRSTLVPVDGARLTAPLKEMDPSLVEMEPPKTTFPVPD